MWFSQEAEPAFKLHLLDAATSFLVRWLSRVRDAAAAAGNTAAARHGLHEEVRSPQACWFLVLDVDSEYGSVVCSKSDL